VLDEELARHVVDGEPFAAGTRPQDQHRLVVLRGESGLCGRVLAEAQELSHRLAEGRQPRVIAGAQAVATLGFLQQQGPSY
jgi:hypothetical protein